jgi:hypothetical protein
MLKYLNFLLKLRFWTRNHNYWIKRGLKGPKPTIGFGNLWDRIFTPMPLLEMEWYKKYGKVYGYKN